MKIEDLFQKAKKWNKNLKKNSKEYIYASEISTIMDFNPYKNPKQITIQKLFFNNEYNEFHNKNKDFYNKYTKHGNETEPIARNCFEKQMKLTFPPFTFVDNQTHIFKSFLDGYNIETNTILEIKCPYIQSNDNVSHEWDDFFNEGNIPKRYYTQIQCELYCSQAKFAYFFVYFNEKHNLPKKVIPSKKFIHKIIKRGEEYLEFLSNAKKELEESTYLKLICKM
ncbi:lambda-exonuclease family protein [Candidatus Phytoplasma pini]|uniref:YqaJ viral recombinase domain-containing protein n=1 Tax=Candidatus Phytoplasma pini TaxID=267362 RepID=A0A559KJ25_9MOLU|nr:YqaJ viral recombinase family protein [Candidatus Phytoplasma pini]TVY12132.1 hypothetical protein MDPP_00344 [Candidatus Phytoplasma pini]